MDDGVAGDFEGAVARAVVLEGRAAAVPLPAVELDDQAEVRPVAVRLVALGAQEDPVVEAGEGEAVPSQEGREPLLQLAALAACGLFADARQGELELSRTSLPRIALQKLG